MLLFPFIYIYVLVLPALYKKYGDSFKIFIFVLFAIELAIIAFFAIPKYDLSVNFEFMSYLEKNKIGPGNMEKLNLTKFAIYKLYFVFDLLCFIFIKIGNYHLLPCFCVLIDYVIWGYITFDWNKNHKESYNYNNLSLVILLSMMPYINALSGIRNALAMSLFALALYRDLEKEKKIFWNAILVIMSILIHPSVIMIIPFWILAREKKICVKIKLLLVIFSVFVENSLILIGINSNNEFIQAMSYKLMFYTGEDQYRNSYSYYIVDVVCIALFIVVTMKNHFMKNKIYANFECFFLLYGVFIIGNASNYDMVLRPSYLIGCLSTPFTNYICERIKTKKIFRLCFKVVIYVICLYELSLSYKGLCSMF